MSINFENLHINLKFNTFHGFLGILAEKTRFCFHRILAKNKLLREFVLTPHQLIYQFILNFINRFI